MSCEGGLVATPPLPFSNTSPAFDEPTPVADAGVSKASEDELRNHFSFLGILAGKQVRCVDFPGYARSEGWRDAWGQPVRAACREGERTVVLPGPDRLYDTEDDIVIDEGTLTYVNGVSCGAGPLHEVDPECVDSKDPTCGM
ncbi:MAG: hypothetical protein HOV80_09005 [Polyangiaceae bacterium]|nr:hypothetical protein [Polyangiaceae bacterium]